MGVELDGNGLGAKIGKNWHGALYPVVIVRFVATLGGAASAQDRPQTLEELGFSMEPTPIEAGSDPCRLFETEELVPLNLVLQQEGITVPLKFPESYLAQRGGGTTTARLFVIGIGDFLPLQRGEQTRRYKNRVRD